MIPTAAITTSMTSKSTRVDWRSFAAFRSLPPRSSGQLRQAGGRASEQQSERSLSTDSPSLFHGTRVLSVYLCRNIPPSFSLTGAICPASPGLSSGLALLITSCAPAPHPYTICPPTYPVCLSFTLLRSLYCTVSRETPDLRYIDNSIFYPILSLYAYVYLYSPEGPLYPTDTHSPISHTYMYIVVRSSSTNTQTQT